MSVGARKNTLVQVYAHRIHHLSSVFRTMIKGSHLPICIDSKLSKSLLQRSILRPSTLTRKRSKFLLEIHRKILIASNAGKLPSSVEAVDEEQAETEYC
ncbi:hypothetical protein LguiB_005473 [Lonicera macranthoides]